MYSCHFESLTTSGSQKYTSNVEVVVECQPPTISTSATGGVLAQTIKIGNSHAFF